MWQHLKRALEEFAQIKLKSMFMPRGCRVLHLKIRRPSALRLSLVLWRPARTTATIISSVVWPGEEKCLATGRSAFFETDLRCSQNLSPSLRPVSPTYDRVHARQVMIYTRLLVVHENLCRMVRGSPGVLILEAGLVHRGCWSWRLGWFRTATGQRATCEWLGFGMNYLGTLTGVNSCLLLRVAIFGKFHSFVVS